MGDQRGTGSVAAAMRKARAPPSKKQRTEPVKSTIGEAVRLVGQPSVRSTGPAAESSVLPRAVSSPVLPLVGSPTAVRPPAVGSSVSQFLAPWKSDPPVGGTVFSSVGVAAGALLGMGTAEDMQYLSSLGNVKAICSLLVSQAESAMISRYLFEAVRPQLERNHPEIVRSMMSLVPKGGPLEVAQLREQLRGLDGKLVQVTTELSKADAEKVKLNTELEAERQKTIDVRLKHLQSERDLMSAQARVEELEAQVRGLTLEKEEANEKFVAEAAKYGLKGIDSAKYLIKKAQPSVSYKGIDFLSMDLPPNYDEAVGLWFPEEYPDEGAEAGEVNEAVGTSVEGQSFGGAETGDQPAEGLEAALPGPNNEG